MSFEAQEYSNKASMAADDAASTPLGQSRPHKRRPHTKSRNGCTTCKRRRVKCDETRPICKNCQHLRLECRYVSPASMSYADLQMMNLKLLHHYDTVVSKTISDAGISTAEIWCSDVVEMGFKYPFLMHAILMFSATHLAQTEPKEYCNAVVQHRQEALSLLRNDVQNINSENLDPLVATSVLLILDAMANATSPSRMTPSSLPAATWLHHVRGAATILLAVGVLPPTSKFYSFMGVDLLDLANCYPHPESNNQQAHVFSDLQCFIPELQGLYPVAFNSPYFSSLAFLDKLNSQRQCADFILRVFSFPALMDGEFVKLLSSGDKWAKEIVGAYYRFVRTYVKEMQNKVWFLNGVANVLPIDMDNQFGGLGFVTDALPVSRNVDSILAKFDASFAAAEHMTAEAAAKASKSKPNGRSASADVSGSQGTPNTSLNRSSNTSSTPLPNQVPAAQLAAAAQMPTSIQMHTPGSTPNPQNHKSQFLDSVSANSSAGPSPTTNISTNPNSIVNSPETVGATPPPNSAGYPPLNSQMYVNDVMPNYGRIQKTSVSATNMDYAPMPGSGLRQTAVQQPPPRRRSIRPGGGYRMLPNRTARNIIRPGMMGMPLDPSVPDDLLGDFEFADLEYPRQGAEDYAPRDIVFDTETLEWKPQSQAQNPADATQMQNLPPPQSQANSQQQPGYGSGMPMLHQSAPNQLIDPNFQDPYAYNTHEVKQEFNEQNFPGLSDFDVQDTYTNFAA